VLTQRVARLEEANRALGTRHERLDGLASEPLPLEPLPLPRLLASDAAPPVGYRRVVEALERRAAARRKARAWAEAASAYPDSAPSAASADVKDAANAAVAGALATRRFGGLTLSHYLRGDARRIVLVLDGPSLRTSRAVCERCSDGFPAHQIVVPQMDAVHYKAIVTAVAECPYVGARLQRLDHWLEANKGRGFRCVAFVADFETQLLGRLKDRIVPAHDLMRFFRYGYPDDHCLLALTVALRPPLHDAAWVVDFVQHEASINGYRAVLKTVRKYHLAFFLFDITAVSAASEGHPQTEAERDLDVAEIAD